MAEVQGEEAVLKAFLREPVGGGVGDFVEAAVAGWDAKFVKRLEHGGFKVVTIGIEKRNPMGERASRSPSPQPSPRGEGERWKVSTRVARTEGRRQIEK